MPCLAIALAFFVPRITILVLWLLGHFNGVWQTALWPILGFIFLPYTTVAYGMAYAFGNGLEGLWLAIFVGGVILDLGSTGGAGHTAIRKER